MDDQQSTLNEPEQETAAQAFARLDGRIAMMGRAVEHLATERASIDIPDYSAILGQMSTCLAAVAQGLAGIAEKPAMQLTPEGLAARMDAAAEKSRASDKATLREAREAHQDAARIIHSLVRVVTSADEQRSISFGRQVAAWSPGAFCGRSCPMSSCAPSRLAGICPKAWRRILLARRHFGTQGFA